MSETIARRLRLVSSDVNVLVLPLLLRHVVITTPDHVSQLSTTLLPKRKHHIPALKSRLHIIPRLLSSYKVESCVLVVNDRRPSIETALASVAPVFCSISKLAITGHNLQANAYWLRQHPIHPRTMMLLHYGSPHLVNFYDPIFKKVTHFYTSITTGHRFSSIPDLPSLTHLAVTTRPELPEKTAQNVATSLRDILKRCTKLEMLVLVLDFRVEDALDGRTRAWEGWLEKCLADERFVLLQDFRSARVEWNDMVFGDVNVWDRAKEWKKAMAAECKGAMTPAMRFQAVKRAFSDNSARRMRELEAAGFFLNHREPEWEIDLVQRDDYHHKQADDPDLRGGGFHSAFG